MRRLVLAFAAAAFSLAMAGVAPADAQTVFRYKSAFAGGNTNPEPENPEYEPDIPSACPEATGAYSASKVLPVDGGCLYTDPGVEIVAFELHLPPVPVSLDNWCSDVWQGSSGVDHGLSEINRDAAAFSGGWSHAGDVSFATYVLCSGGVPVSDDDGEDEDLGPHTPVGVLTNADFEMTQCGNGHCGWTSERFGGLIKDVGAALVDKQVGGNRAIGAPWQWGGRDRNYQDVAVPAALTATGFDIDLEWIQSASVAHGRGSLGVWFYQGNTKTGQSMSAYTDVDIPWSWFERSHSARAPAGTTKIRVLMDNYDGNARFDNIRLRVNGVEYSTINGVLGKPARGRDVLLNASAEQGNANWREIGSNSYPPYGTIEASRAIDPFNRINNAWYSAQYQEDKVMFQQVWIGEAQVSRRLDLRWLQASDSRTTTSGLVFVQPYTITGAKIGERIGRGSHSRVPMFWTTEHVVADIPAGAAYLIVTVETGGRIQMVDSITMEIDGEPYAAFLGSSPQSVNYCPAYVNTVNGNGTWSKPMRGLAEMNGLWDEPLVTGYVAGEVYKNYCIPKGADGGILLAEYEIQTMKAYGGFEYTAYDADGNVLARSKGETGSGAVDWDESRQVIETFHVPANTSYLQKRFVRSPNTWSANFSVSHWAAIDQYGIKAKNVNFRYFASVNDLIAALDHSKFKTKLYDGSADIGTGWWVPKPGSPGGVAVHQQTISTVESSYALPPSSSASTSTVPCDGSCGQMVTNNAFKAVDGAVDAYQDVHVLPYGFTGGETVTLSWTQSATGAGFADWLAAWNSSDNAASMSIEAWGMNGELLASARSSEITQLFFLSRRSVSIQLPENTWKLRAVMHFPRASRALIDEIRLAVGSVDLTANDQVPIPWTH